jgi:peroxiredoxin
MATKSLKIGSAAPDFNLFAVDGKNYSLGSFSDKEILTIIFSCNHCPYVQAYEDRIKAIQNDYFKKSVQIIAINSNDASKYEEDSFESMKKRASDKIFNFPYLRDEEQSVAKAFDASHTPEVFVFDGERKLVYHGKIDDNWKEPEKIRNNYLKDVLDEVLAKEEVSVPETFSIGCTIKWKN